MQNEKERLRKSRNRINRYHALKAMGKCTKCGKAKGETSLCEECRKAANKKANKYYRNKVGGVYAEQDK